MIKKMGSLELGSQKSPLYIQYIHYTVKIPVHSGLLTCVFLLVYFTTLSYLRIIL
jgi:hypothetical protein